MTPPAGQTPPPAGQTSPPRTSLPQPAATPPPANAPSPETLIERLEAFPNPNPERDYEIRCETSELSCNCPFTGQPDIATLTLTYTPDQHVVELKSLKMYLWGFRDIAIAHEQITNQILDDLVSTLSPRSMRVETSWNVRGGIATTIGASYPS